MRVEYSLTSARKEGVRRKGYLREAVGRAKVSFWRPYRIDMRIKIEI